MEDVWNGLAGAYASLVRTCAPLLAGSSDSRGHGLQRDDARLRGTGHRRRAAGPVPHLAEQHHRSCLRRAVSAPRLRRSPALEHRPPVPVDPGAAAARVADRPSGDARRIRPLEAHGRAHGGGRRSLGHVPDRPAHRSLGRPECGPRSTPSSHRSTWAGSSGTSCPTCCPRGGRPEGSRPMARGCSTPGQAPGRHCNVPSRGRRRDGHGRHELGTSAFGKRLRGHFRVRDDRAGQGPARVHEGIDILVTPDGKSVAMVHANNGSSDLDAWIGLFGQSLKP